MLRAMTTSPSLIPAARELLAEAFRGRDAGPVWFLDDAGLLATARGMPAEQASRRVTEAGATIAGHVEHVRWFLSKTNAFARGERPRIEWSESWSVEEVDEPEWQELVNELEREFETLHAHLGEGALDEDDEMQVKSLLATLAHVGYHVGAIRQMARCVA